MISADTFLTGFFIAIVAIMFGWGAGELLRYQRRRKLTKVKPPVKTGDIFAMKGNRFFSWVLKFFHGKR